MPKPITAISIKCEAKDALIEALDLNNVPIKDIIDRFDRTIFVFRRSAYVMAARMHCAEIEDSDFRALDMAEFREIKLAAAPKKDMYNRREATFARARYDRLHARDDRTIRFKPKRAAHKGWVTKNEFKYLASEGRFTHVYRVEYIFHGNRHVEEGNCVDYDQAMRAKRKVKKMIERKFIGSVIVSAQVLPIKKGGAKPVAPAQPQLFG